MAKNKEVSEDYFQDLLKKYQAEALRERRKKVHKQAVQAGKELVLVCLMQKTMGANVEGDMEVILAGFLSDYPDALKEVLAYYNKMKDAPSLAKALLAGFCPTIVEGQLQIHFNWRKVEDSKLDMLVQKFTGGLQENA